MKTPEQIEAWNEALETAAKKVKALSHGLDCSCDGCVARENDVVTILEQRIAEPANAPHELPPTKTP